MAHISAHSAVKTGRDNPEIVMARLVRTRQLDRSFQILSNIAEKQGKDPPSRDDFNKEHTWGHHEPVSADHMPYERNPHIHDGLYVTDPACISAAGECYSGPSNRDPGVPMGQNMLSLGCRTNNTSTSMNIAGPDGSALCGAGVCGSRGGGCIGSSDCGSRVPPGFGRGAAELAGQVIGGVLGASLCGGGGGGGGG